MYTIEQLRTAFFFDIETKPAANSLTELDPRLADLWRSKYAKRCYEKYLDEILKTETFAEADNYDTDTLKAKKVATADEVFVKFAPLYAEFSKVSCISYGIIDSSNNDEIRIESLINRETEDENEAALLNTLRTLLDTVVNYKLAGFNIKGFDIPYLIKRYLILGLALPKCLKITNKKPWEVTFLDVMDDYKGLSWESASLDVLAAVLGIPSPKDKFNNYEISTLMKQGKITVDDVVEYCEKDVRTVILIALRFIR